MKEELRKAIELIKNTCDEDTIMCERCELYRWCSEQRQKSPANWVSEKEWHTVEFDIKNGVYNDNVGNSNTYFDYIKGLTNIAVVYQVSSECVAFGGWFYNSSCSWHKSLILKPEIPTKIRFYVKY